MDGAAAPARLRRRREFQYVARGAKAARPGLVLQARARAEPGPGPRVGFTATKKIGGAVDRNRAKRRLREAARRVVAENGRAELDYVLIARAGTADRPWALLLDDLKSALITVHLALSNRKRADDAAGAP